MAVGFAFNGAQEYTDVDNLINAYIDDATMKALMYLCLRHDIDDNNIKAEVCKVILGPEFVEIGTGTNRITFRHNGLAIKIALDRRGLIDNRTEYKRSLDLPQYVAKVYESNYLINICEYVIVMDQDTFMENSGPIKETLRELSRNYLFEDLGFTQKNAYNWGLRETKMDQEEVDLYGGEVQYDVVILDYGYLHPLYNQQDKVFECPLCGKKLYWNSTYTKVTCSGKCSFAISPLELKRKIDTEFESIENEMISSVNNSVLPDLTTVDEELSVIKKGENEDDLSDESEVSS